ncbi:YceI family protein [Niveispirillum sp. KHB5.9]|uniref:YceI family protein n=1 Tax=Niveispirillum sp. KHB5.9 TaxID=3400269 RepID=UPI003A8577D5
MSRLAAFFLAFLFIWQPAQAMPAPHMVTPDNVGVGFSIRYMLVAKASGRFNDITGSYSFDPEADELGAIDVTIGTGSVDTGSPGRDRDLAGEDFFWTDRYPTMHFISRHAVRTGPHAGRVEGDLTLRGVTRPVVLMVALGDHMATATTSVKRSEFGMRPGLAGLVIADKVDIRIEIRDLPGGTAPATGAPPPPA